MIAGGTKRVEYEVFVWLIHYALFELCMQGIHDCDTYRSRITIKQSIQLSLFIVMINQVSVCPRPAHTVNTNNAAIQTIMTPNHDNEFEASV